jgi:transcriptional regulator with XRE-family HTH domain
MGWKQELAVQIKNARESQRLTQQQLADKLRLSRNIISRYENEKDVPAIEVLSELARVLDTVFRIQGLQVVVESTSQRLRPVPKQLRLDFEKAQRYRDAVIEITPSEGHIFITAKIPA